MRDVERVPRGSNGWRGPPTLESMPDSTDTRERSSVLGGLSWFQVLAGALAAMTSAWIASALGVAGTIVGAALGSLVVTITSSLYASTLDKGRTLIVQTDGGQVVETEAEPGHTAEALAAVRRATHEEVTGAGDGAGQLDVDLAGRVVDGQAPREADRAHRGGDRPVGLGGGVGVGGHASSMRDR